tara:strand:+ start:363 stop:620 length:258 start_codon:yes stop_codon:yes gene_type:complete
MKLSEKNNSNNEDIENKKIKGDDSISEINNDENTINKDESNYYKFGWSKYSERTNGRYAMIGFTAILIIELISKKSFLFWAGILN